MNTLDCRSCGKPKPVLEVATIFNVYGKERVRFKSCVECRRLARKVYRENKKKKEKVV